MSSDNTDLIVSPPLLDHSRHHFEYRRSLMIQVTLERIYHGVLKFIGINIANAACGDSVIVCTRMNLEAD